MLSGQGDQTKRKKERKKERKKDHHPHLGSHKCPQTPQQMGESSELDMGPDQSHIEISVLMSSENVWVTIKKPPSLIYQLRV